MFFNSHSFNDKLAELYSLIDGSLFNYQFDYIFACETWLHDTIIDGFLLCSSKCNIIRCGRHDGSRGGGVCAFVSDNLNFTAVDLPARFLNLKILCIDLILNNVKQHFICVFRPPGYDLNKICELMNV